jgi:hypothetical protein
MDENDQVLVVVFRFVDQFTSLLGPDAILPYVAQGIEQLEHYANWPAQ